LRMLRSVSVAVLAMAVSVGGSATALATQSAQSAQAAQATQAAGGHGATHQPLVVPHSQLATHLSGSAGSAGSTGPELHRGPNGLPAEPVFGNWSGYEVNGANGAYTSVTSNWVQPWVNCASNQALGIWVGLDGEQGAPYTNSVEQTGTGVTCNGGSASYYAWYEMVPNGPVSYGNAVVPGDNLTATVTYGGGEQYTLYLRDITQNWTENTTVTAPVATQNSSAEVVVEAPGKPTLPLAGFGFAGFNGSAVNGQTLNAVGAQPMTMEQNNVVTATPSALSSTGYFTVDYGTGASVAGVPVVAYQTASPRNQLIDNWTPSGNGFMGQTILRNTSPSITALPGGGFEEAFQTAYNTLMVIGTAFNFNSQLGMAGNTSPSIAASPNGGFEVAFQANTGQLWYFTPQNGGVPEGAAMASGTSPSIAALATGGYETAFQGSNGHLMEAGTTITWDAELGMMAGTSPAIAASPAGGFQAAFQANTGYLYEQNLTTGGLNQNYLMAKPTSPAIAALSGGGYETAIQGSNGHLQEIGAAITWDADLGMLTETSPSITAIPGNTFEVAFEANTGYLYTQNLTTGGVTQGYGMAGTSTSPAIAY
jgi:Peptidase A4 family